MAKKTAYLFENVWTIPNIISFIRILLIPVFGVLYYKGELLWALIILALSGLSDLVDGKIARAFNQVSELGKMLDPIADKLLVSSAMIAFVQMGLLPAWMVIIIIAREFIISGFRLVASDAGVVLAAGWWGKFKTAFQMIMCILLIINFDNKVMNVVELVFIYLSLATTIISMLDYLIKNRKVISDM